MSPTAASSSEGDVPPDPRRPQFTGPDFPRALQSEGVSKSGRPREVETTRQHVRLALENWEKQFADVLRYERAKVEDDANRAAYRRALTRSGAALALAVTALSPVATNSADLQKIGVGPTNLGNGLTLLGGLSLATCVASVWWPAISRFYAVDSNKLVLGPNYRPSDSTLDRWLRSSNRQRTCPTTENAASTPRTSSVGSLARHRHRRCRTIRHQVRPITLEREVGCADGVSAMVADRKQH